MLTGKTRMGTAEAGKGSVRRCAASDRDVLSGLPCGNGIGGSSVGRDLGGLSQQPVFPFFGLVGLPSKLGDKPKYPKQAGHSGAGLIIHFILVIQIDSRA